MTTLAIQQAPGGVQTDVEKFDPARVHLGDPLWQNVEASRVYRCRVTLVEEPDGYSVFASDLRGTISQGDTIDEALANITDALQLTLAEYLSAGAIPWEAIEIEGEHKVERWVTVHV